MKSSPNYELNEFGNWRVYDLKEVWLFVAPLAPAVAPAVLPPPSAAARSPPTNLSVAAPIEFYWSASLPTAPLIPPLENLLVWEKSSVMFCLPFTFWAPCMPIRFWLLVLWEPPASGDCTFKAVLLMCVVCIGIGWMPPAPLALVTPKLWLFMCLFSVDLWPFDSFGLLLLISCPILILSWILSEDKGSWFGPRLSLFESLIKSCPRMPPLAPSPDVPAEVPGFIMALLIWDLEIFELVVLLDEIMPPLFGFCPELVFTAVLCSIHPPALGFWYIFKCWTFELL